MIDIFADELETFYAHQTYIYRDVKDVLIVMMIIFSEFGFVLLSCCYKCCHWWWCTAIIIINYTLTPWLILYILPRTTSCRSFVPPVRDEESETQRKAHAKRVRETRRSTQGVTLDEIKSAEELVKKKNLNSNGEVSERQVHGRMGGRDVSPLTTTGWGCPY